MIACVHSYACVRACGVPLRNIVTDQIQENGIAHVVQPKATPTFAGQVVRGAALPTFGTSVAKVGHVAGAVRILVLACDVLSDTVACCEKRAAHAVRVQCTTYNVQRTSPLLL